MKRLCLRLAVALLVLSCATKATKGLLEGDVPVNTLAQEGDLGFGRFSFPAREIPLPSGLRVAYETAPSRGMVSVVLALDVGSTLDPAGREGLAHYAEHLVFRNQPRGLPLAIELQRMGAIYNAFTTLDATTYHAMAPSQALPALLDVMAGLMQRPLQQVPATDAAVELEVVRSEFSLKNETGVYGQLRNWMQTLLVEPTHPYRRAAPARAWRS